MVILSVNIIYKYKLYADLSTICWYKIKIKYNNICMVNNGLYFNENLDGNIQCRMKYSCSCYWYNVINNKLLITQISSKNKNHKLRNANIAIAKYHISIYIY